MSYIEDNCKNCPDRKIGCHNVETCSYWAEHEKKKEKLYKTRKEICERTSIEKTYFKRKMRRHDHDTRR